MGPTSVCGRRHICAFCCCCWCSCAPAHLCVETLYTKHGFTKAVIILSRQHTCTLHIGRHRKMELFSSR